MSSKKPEAPKPKEKDIEPTLTAAPVPAPAPKTANESVEDTLNDDALKSLAYPKDKVIFILKDHQLNGPILAGGVEYRTRWNGPDKTHLLYVVDEDKAELFARHTHVLNGKIIRALRK